MALSRNELNTVTLQAVLQASDEATIRSRLETVPIGTLDSKREVVPAMYLVDTVTEPVFKMLALQPDEDRVVSTEVLNKKFYTADVSNLFYSLFQQADQSSLSGSVVVDAGANIGYYTLFSLASGFEVVAFEPQVRACRMLRMSATANDFHKLKIINAALAGTCGDFVRIPYFKGNWGESSSFKDSANCNYKMLGADCVETTTLDFHVHKPVFLLKIDVEGHEAEVFRGASKMMNNFRPKHILMEYRPEQIDIARRLLLTGYVAYNVREWIFFGQNGSEVFNISFAPKGLVNLNLAMELDMDNIHEFTTALALRSCDIGCFTDLYFLSTA